MKDKIIESLTIVIVIIATLITLLSLNINDLNFVEIGNYVLVSGEKDLIIAKEEKQELKDNNIVYIDYINKHLTINTGKVKDVNVVDNKKIYTVINNSKKVNIDSSCVIGNYLYIIPWLGYIINYLLTRDGFLLFIVLPLLIVCVYELFKFIDGISKYKA
ncbi:MAG: hypothetical protein IJF92_02075 [Bacilli bacterium]|nr:hypothetical protein [Bacilli bacterium]